MDAYRAAWASPASNSRFATLQMVFGRLFDALRHNQLYPEAVILGRPGRQDGALSRRAGEPAQGLRAAAQFLRRQQIRDGRDPSPLHRAAVLQDAVSGPARAARPGDGGSGGRRALPPASDLPRGQSRRVQLGGEGPVPRRPDHALDEEAGPLRRNRGPHDQPRRTRPRRANCWRTNSPSEVERYIQKRHRLAFQVFDAATALEEYARAHIAGRSRRRRTHARRTLRPAAASAPPPGRTPRSDRRHAEPDHEPRRRGDRPRHAARGRARSAARCTPSSAAARASRPCGMRRMFEVLPNNAERLRFLNFLYPAGETEPGLLRRTIRAILPWGEVALRPQGRRLRVRVLVRGLSQAGDRLTVEHDASRRCP